MTELDPDLWGPAPDPDDVPPEPVWETVPVMEVRPGDFVHPPAPADAVYVSGTRQGGVAVMLRVDDEIAVDARATVRVLRWPNGERWPDGDWRA